jgi:hypothetical protein
MGLRVHQNEAAIFTVEEKIIPRAGKSATEQIKCEDHAPTFL